MEIMRTETTPGPPRSDDIMDPTGCRVVIETDEHEEISLIAASDEELEAKLEDFMTWAS